MTMTTYETCEACHARPAGHGHFALYCEPCSVLPYGSAAPAPTVSCERCGEAHPAEYSHEGRYGEGHVYAVTCTADLLTDYYTEEGLDR